MNTIYKVETGEFVKDNDPIELTSVEGEAMLFTDAEIDGVLDDLNDDGDAFAPGRPGDRNGPKK